MVGGRDAVIDQCPIGRLAETLHVLDDCGLLALFDDLTQQRGSFYILHHRLEIVDSGSIFAATNASRSTEYCALIVRSPTAAIASEPPIAALHVVDIVLSRRRRRCL